MLLEEETDKNTFDFDELNTIREKIELMSKFNQIEVLRILHGYENITLNENKYGIHVNLSDISNDVIEKIKFTRAIFCTRSIQRQVLRLP